ncbi:MAG: SUMF1/EgtB/PvdO family nonheme iron enzyme, partial [Anaerolineales bacterium]
RGAALPSEAQWEKAARGTDGRTYPWGEGISCNLAVYEGCSRDVEHIGDHPNGISPFGIHDMSGNVWEWVADWYSEKYYRDSPVSNPLGPVEGIHRVMRGGTWDSPAENLQTFNRLKYKPAFFTEGIGFRCARDAKP